MILFTVLCLVTIIAFIVAVAILTVGGTIAIICGADIIIAIFIVWWFFFRKKYKEKSE